MKLLVYSTEGGYVAVVRPAPGAQRPGESEEAFLERLKARVVPRGARRVVVVDEAELPSDRSERDGWRLDRKGRVLVGKGRRRPATAASADA